MIELSQKGTELNRGFGGDTLNTAVYIASQVNADNLVVHYVTALGTDSFSSVLGADWQKEGVKTALRQRLDHKLPAVYVIVT
ncbi:sugar kinase, partial [Pectobacterium brasiliense]|uniref:PfkB family carbohydrate kinase n=1 Tax=Pectobacterium brasiliense TaxID=180957 RepID=UPI001F073723